MERLTVRELHLIGEWAAERNSDMPDGAYGEPPAGWSALPEEV